MVGIVRLLGSLEAQSLIDPFVLQLDAIAATAGERTLIAVLAAEVGRPDLAVRIARRARRNGVLLAVTGYPIIDVPEDGPEQALALAVIRQESAFDPGAVSPSGARGLMQLMPATARYVAKAMGIRYSARKLLADPGYNLTLGTAYLDRLLGNYDVGPTYWRWPPTMPGPGGSRGGWARSATRAIARSTSSIGLRRYPLTRRATTFSGSSRGCRSIVGGSPKPTTGSLSGAISIEGGLEAPTRWRTVDSKNPRATRHKTAEEPGARNKR